MSETLLAKGQVTALAGEAYRGVRQRFHALLLELSAEPVHAAILTSEFSNFYRSLPQGQRLDLEVVNHNAVIQIRLTWQSDQADQPEALELGRRLRLSQQNRLGSGLWHHEVQIQLGVLRRIDQQICQGILDQRSSEELSHEVSATTDRLRATRQVLNRVQEELNIAADIQRSMLVSERELNQRCQGLDVGALMVPSKEVGGDLYDCIPLGNERYCLCVGDVSGKGVPASLTMSTCLTLVRSYAETLSSPSEMMARINQRLSHNNESCTFTTLVIGILDGITGQFRFCNAGHNPTFILDGEDKIQVIKTVHGPAVGAVEDMSYGETEILLTPQSSIVMYSDGASEMFSPKRERYGFKRMEAFFRNAAEAGMPRLVRQFMRELRDFAGSEPPHDDITILAARLLPRLDLSHEGLQITMPNTLEGLALVKSQVDQFGNVHHIKRALLRKLQVVLDELLSNVVRYGCEHLPEQTPIEVRLLRQGHRLLIQLRDPGRPFDPFDAPEPDLSLALDDRPIGGLGVHMVRKMVSSYRYQRIGEWNQTDLEMLV